MKSPLNGPIRARGYLNERGVPLSVAIRRWGSFGREVKRRYVAVHGIDPRQVNIRFNGSHGRGCIYQETDRPLLDAAFAVVFPDYS